MKKKLICLLSSILIFMVAWTSVSFAHGGRTDSQGGHHDYKNVSGLGPYHYHCGGYPAHLHSGGRCPYAGGAGSTGTSSVSKTKAAPIKAPAVTVKSVNSNYLKISWGKRSKAVKYYVYRATSKAGTYKKIASTTRTYYNDKTVKNKKTYYYKVKAIAKLSKNNSKLSPAKSGKIQFNGQIQVSQKILNLSFSEPTYVILIKSTGTKDDMVAYYDSEYVDVRWGEKNQDGWYPLTVYSNLGEEEYDCGEETEIELVFENHKRLYKKIVTVTFES